MSPRWCGTTLIPQYLVVIDVGGADRGQAVQWDAARPTAPGTLDLRPVGCVEVLVAGSRDSGRVLQSPSAGSRRDQDAYRQCVRALGDPLDELLMSQHDVGAEGMLDSGSERRCDAEDEERSARAMRATGCATTDPSRDTGALRRVTASAFGRLNAYEPRSRRNTLSSPTTKEKFASFAH